MENLGLAHIFMILMFCSSNQESKLMPQILFIEATTLAYILEWDQLHYTVFLPFNCLNFLSYLLYPLITLRDFEYLISLSRQLNLNWVQYVLH